MSCSISLGLWFFVVAVVLFAVAVVAVVVDNNKFVNNQPLYSQFKMTFKITF